MSTHLIYVIINNTSYDEIVKYFMLARRSPSFATRSGDIFFKPLLFVSFPTVYTKLESVFFCLAKLFPVIC